MKNTLKSNLLFQNHLNMSSSLEEVGEFVFFVDTLPEDVHLDLKPSI